MEEMKGEDGDKSEGKRRMEEEGGENRRWSRSVDKGEVGVKSEGKRRMAEERGGDQRLRR